MTENKAECKTETDKLEAATADNARLSAELAQVKAELSLFQKSYTALWRKIASMSDELIGRPVPRNEQRRDDDAH